MEMDAEILMFFIFQSKDLGNHAVVRRLEALLKMSRFYALILGGNPFLPRYSSLSLAWMVRRFTEAAFHRKTSGAFFDCVTHTNLKTLF